MEVTWGWALVGILWVLIVFVAGYQTGVLRERRRWINLYGALKRRIHASNYGSAEPPWR